jgi:hypothetical protein
MSENTTGESGSGVARYLNEDQHNIELCTVAYRETELEAKITGPDVTADDYYESVTITKLDKDSDGFHHGWSLLSLPTDPDAIRQFIEALEQSVEQIEDMEGIDAQ